MRVPIPAATAAATRSTTIIRATITTDVTRADHTFSMSVDTLNANSSSGVTAMEAIATTTAVIPMSAVTVTTAIIRTEAIDPGGPEAMAMATAMAVSGAA